MLELTLIITAYLLGSISSAVIICRIMGLPDPREKGSGNPGATNVLRIGGKKAAAYTLAGDMLKGLIPVLIAQLSPVSGVIVAATALAAFLGHLYPLFFSFRGGKGVATAFGAILGLSPGTAAAALIVWAIVAKVFKKSSLAALLAALLTPLFLWWFATAATTILIVVCMIALLVWRHRSNIKRLRSGAESQIGH